MNLEAHISLAFSPQHSAVSHRPAHCAEVQDSSSTPNISRKGAKRVSPTDFKFSTNFVRSNKIGADKTSAGKQ